MEPQHWSKLGAGGNGGEERKIRELSEQANCKRLAVRAELMSIKTGSIFWTLQSQLHGSVSSIGKRNKIIPRSDVVSPNSL